MSLVNADPAQYFSRFSFNDNNNNVADVRSNDGDIFGKSRQSGLFKVEINATIAGWRDDESN